ncbi:MAG: P1 family peptidase [Robiginitomaculum sp.]|nr:P1 family peptidase [Robiginitomaculum sp.]
MSKLELKNLLTDIAGITVGNSHDVEVQTGVTLVLPDAPALCAVDVRGGGPGTRETDALDADGSVTHVHAIVLAGGSVYGLEAASSIANILGARRIGYEVAPAPVPVSPIVPAAILFDNANGGNKNWGEAPPFAGLGKQAFANAAVDFKLGKVGAGYGATAGLYPGGLGSVSERVGDITVSALIAANPVGSPYMPNTDCFWAWDCEIGDEYGGRKPPKDYAHTSARDTKLEFLRGVGASTVIGVIATDAKLSHAELRRLAVMAQDGIALAVRPSHTPMDGDTLFALSTETKDISKPRVVSLSELGAAAARCVARALAKGVYDASS